MSLNNRQPPPRRYLGNRPLQPSGNNRFPPLPSSVGAFNNTRSNGPPNSHHPFPAPLMPSSAPPPLPAGSKSGSSSYNLQQRSTANNRNIGRLYEPRRRPPSLLGAYADKNNPPEPHRNSARTPPPGGDAPPPNRPPPVYNRPHPLHRPPSSSLNERQTNRPTSVAASRLPSKQIEPPDQLPPPPIANHHDDDAHSKSKLKPPDPQAQHATPAKAVSDQNLPATTAAQAPAHDLSSAVESSSQTPANAASNDVASESAKEFGFALITREQISGGRAARDLLLPAHMKALQDDRRLSAQVWSSSSMGGGSRRQASSMRGGWQEFVSMKSEQKPSQTSNALFASLHFVLTHSIAPPANKRQRSLQTAAESQSAPASLVSLPLANVHLFSGAEVQTKVFEGELPWLKELNAKGWKVESSFWSLKTKTKKSEDRKLDGQIMDGQNAESADEGISQPPSKRARVEEKAAEVVKPEESRSSSVAVDSDNRSWPPGCRYLVLWGFESSAASHRTHSAYIEQTVGLLRKSPSFVEAFSSPIGGASVQGVGVVDIHQPPFVFRWWRSAEGSNGGINAMLSPSNHNGSSGSGGQQQQQQQQTSESSIVTFKYKSLFSGNLTKDHESANSNWRYTSPYTDHSAPPMYSRRSESVLTSLVEFEDEEQARNFFVANTYSSLSDIWCTRIWSRPDYDGIKYWLHTLLNNASTWTHGSCSQPSTEKAVSTVNTIYAPFLTREEVGGAVAVREVGSPGLGLELDVGSGVKVVKLTCLCPTSKSLSKPSNSTPRGGPGSGPSAASSSSSQVQKVPVVVLEGLHSWASSNLGGVESSWSQMTWLRIPKYICKSWKVGCVETYVARVCLLMFRAAGSGEIILSPVICGSLKDLIGCKSPTVVKMKKGVPTAAAAVPPPPV